MSEQAEKSAMDETDEQVPAFEQELEVYPLRDPSEDPRWALRVMWIWIGIAVFLLLFFLVLLVLGIFYD